MCQDMSNHYTSLDPNPLSYISSFINNFTLYDDVVCYIILEFNVSITLYGTFTTQFLATPEVLCVCVCINVSYSALRLSSHVSTVEKKKDQKRYE